MPFGLPDYLFSRLNSPEPEDLSIPIGPQRRAFHKALAEPDPVYTEPAPPSAGRSAIAVALGALANLSPGGAETVRQSVFERPRELAKSEYQRSMLERQAKLGGLHKAAEFEMEQEKLKETVAQKREQELGRHALDEARRDLMAARASYYDRGGAQGFDKPQVRPGSRLDLATGRYSPYFAMEQGGRFFDRDTGAPLTDKEFQPSEPMYQASVPGFGFQWTPRSQVAGRGAPRTVYQGEGIPTTAGQAGTSLTPPQQLSAKERQDLRMTVGVKRKLKDIDETMRHVNTLGPLWGRIAWNDIKRIGGAGLAAMGFSPQEVKLALKLNEARTSGIFSVGGKVLTPTELDFYKDVFPGVEDTPELAAQKLKEWQYRTDLDIETYRDIMPAGLLRMIPYFNPKEGAAEATKAKPAPGEALRLFVEKIQKSKEVKK